MPPLVVLTLMLAQEPPADAADAAKMERIRKALAETPAIVVASPATGDGAVFRMTIRELKLDRPVLDPRPAVPSYVRPPMRGSHELLEQTTPEAFRAQTLYPLGVPVLTLVDLVGKQIKTAQKKKAEARAREEVRRALEEFLACRADPARTGC